MFFIAIKPFSKDEPDKESSGIIYERVEAHFFQGLIHLKPSSIFAADVNFILRILSLLLVITKLITFP